MQLSQLKEQTKKLIESNPSLKDEILDFYYLAISEIEEGGSETHECQLAFNDMLDLISEENN